MFILAAAPSVVSSIELKVTPVELGINPVYPITQIEARHLIVELRAGGRALATFPGRRLDQMGVVDAWGGLAIAIGR